MAILIALEVIRVHRELLVRTAVRFGIVGYAAVYALGSLALAVSGA